MYIEVKNVEKIFYDSEVPTPALRGVSFSADNGEFIAIVGSSGSGKSTLLHILGFLDRQTNGEYRFDGKEMSDLSEEGLARTRNKRMGFVFQMFNLLPRASVLENVKLPLLYSDAEESLWNKRAKEVIKDVGLTHRIYHDTSQLSGGERQRVAIARALVNRPHVIFADEPTGNLDSASGQTIMEIIQELNEKGHTIFLVTHESYTAAHAKRIITLHDGKIASDALVSRRHLAKDSFRK